MSEQLTPPLAGIRVLDLTRVLSGPYGTMLLGDLGADIVKIEPADEADTARGLTPVLAPGMSSYFASINRNKRSLSLNLKSAKGREIFRRLAADADVVLDNFRPGTLERLGIDYGELRQTVNPRLVTCSISGFGTGNVYSERSSFDLVVQAMGGAMSVTGVPGSSPVRLGIPMGDLSAGLFAAMGILAALQARATSGRGRHVEISMLDGMASLLCYMGGLYTQTGKVPGPQGSGHEIMVPYQAFEAKDLWLVIAIFGDRFYPELCEIVGRPDLAADPRFAKVADRQRNKAAFLDILCPILKQRTADDWIERLLEKRIPCGPINSIDRVLQDPVLLSRNMLVTTEHAAYGKTSAPGNPMKVEGIHDGIASPAPLPGEQTESILRERLGLDAAAIAALKADGVI